jgi:sortase A
VWSQGRIEAYRETLDQEAGPALAVLRIPTLDLAVPVLEGTDDFALNRAVGRIEGTSRLGEGGNIGIAGHRDGFFRNLGSVGPGDRILLETLTGIETFIVEATKIVQPDDVDVLAPTAHPTLTLVTCYPFYFVGPAPQRYIVRAVRAESKPGV